MAVSGGAHSFDSDHELRQFQAQLDKIAPDSLSNYKLREKNGHFTLKQRDAKESVVKIVRTDSDTAEHVQMIAALLENAYKRNVQGINYVKMANALSTLVKASGDVKVETAFRKVHALQQDVAVPSAIQQSQDLIKIIASFTPSNSEYDWDHVSDFAQKFQELINLQKSVPEDEDLLYFLNNIAIAFCAKLQETPLQRLPPTQFQEVFTAFSSLPKLDPQEEKFLHKLQKMHNLLMAFELYKHDFLIGADALITAGHALQQLLGNIELVAFLTRFGLLAEAKAVEDKLVKYFSSPHDKKGLEASINTKEMETLLAFQATDEHSVRAQKVLEKWMAFTPDFQACINTFARLGFDKIALGSVPLGQEVQKAFLDACAKLPELVAQDDLKNGYKVAFICEKLLSLAQAKLPKADATLLCEAIGEALTIASIDYNPIKRISDSFNALTYVLETPRYNLVDATPRHNVPWVIDFRFLRDPSGNACRVQYNAVYEIIDIETDKISLVPYLCKMYKTFGQVAYASSWKGMLLSRR